MRRRKQQNLKKKPRKLVSQSFYKQIHVFGKKVSERILMRKVWDYAIDVKEEFVPRKKKVYCYKLKTLEQVKRKNLVLVLI